MSDPLLYETEHFKLTSSHAMTKSESFPIRDIESFAFEIKRNVVSSSGPWLRNFYFVSDSLILRIRFRGTWFRKSIEIDRGTACEVSSILFYNCMKLTTEHIKTVKADYMRLETIRDKLMLVLSDAISQATRTNVL